MNFDGSSHHIVFKCVLTVVIALIVQFIGIRAIRTSVHRSVKHSTRESELDVKKRQDTLIAILRTTFVGLLWMTVVIIILSQLGVNVAALLTGAGLVGVLFGLSMQNTIKDFLAGTFLLFEKQYRVGDTVSMSGGTVGIPGVTGKVESITLRITKLRDMNGNLVSIRNGEPVIIKNETYSYSSIVLDFIITYESDIEKFKKVINDVGKEIAKLADYSEAVKEPITFLRIDNFADNGVVVRAIGKVKPASQWEIAGEYRQRLLVAVSKISDVTFAHT
ncbi:MAG TPA: mechanosensitive ion channel domain-containing protein [Candidatus Saccharimonadales bacterium]|nr:mechanosensitive ion channel domain-containing protein [Candidatus Saccharimonadales bacterium]